MKNIFSKISFLIVFFLIPFNASSAEYFCLDKEGLLYPLFNKTNCEKSTDKYINKKEFINIINFDQKIRNPKLIEFRKNGENQKIITEKDIKTADAIKFKNDSLKKLKTTKNDQKKLLKILTSKKNIEKQKSEKLARIKKQEKLRLLKGQKRLAKLEKERNERKLKKQAAQNELKQKKIAKSNLLKKKKLERLAKLEKENKFRLLEGEKRLAEIQKRKNQSESVSASKKIIKKPKDELIPDIAVNNELKIILLNKKIVKSSLIPNFSGDLTVIEDLNKEGFKKLVKFNSNLVLIVPKDFEAFSNNTSQNQMMSKVVTGVRSVPNPDFRRLEAEIRDKERKAMLAKRESENYERKLNNTQYSGVGWLDVLSVAANTSGAISFNNRYRSLQNELTSLIDSYSSTPMYLDQEVFSSYTYEVVGVSSEKKAHYDVIQYKNNNFYKQSTSIDENKVFKVAYNIQTQDKKYEELIKKYHTMDNVKVWENKKINDLDIKDFLVKLNSTENTKLDSVKDVYSFLNYEQDKEKSFWKNIFNFSKKKNNTKIASLPNSSSYETKDERFNSVVVVKHGSGMGSGFFVSEDEILTNYHVIEGAMTISIMDINGKKSSAVVIKTDLKRDLALLKTNMKGKPVSFYSGQLKQGEMVEALGHPKGRKFSLTKGWISAIRQESSTYSSTNSSNVLFIQSDVAINPGNSGGPLFYKNKVVGVNTQGLSKKKTEGMNFAVHFSEVKKFILNK